MIQTVRSFTFAPEGAVTTPSTTYFTPWIEDTVSTTSSFLAIASKPRKKRSTLDSSKPTPRKYLAFDLPIGCVSDNRYPSSFSTSIRAASAFGSLILSFYHYKSPGTVQLELLVPEAPS